MSNQPLFDTHCHLDREPLRGDLVNLCQSARATGVQRMVVPSCGAFNWQQVKSVCERVNHSATAATMTANIEHTSTEPSEIVPSSPVLACYYALGLHPYFTAQHQLTDLELLDSQLANRDPACVAVGECGLDFYQDQGDWALQQQLFSAQVALANQHQLPLIIHNRKAHQAMLKILRTQKVISGGVIHGFTGSYQIAMDFVRLGFYIGVGGSITYPRANKTRQAIASLPIESLVLETDAPDMPLFGCQGEPNHPTRVKNVLTELTVIRPESAQTVASAVFQNSNDLFRLCE